MQVGFPLHLYHQGTTIKVVKEDLDDDKSIKCAGALKTDDIMSSERQCCLEKPTS